MEHAVDLTVIPQRALLSGVHDICFRLDPCGLRTREQVTNEHTLHLGAATAAPRLGHERDSDALAE
jgi:hypothetical protein